MRAIGVLGLTAIVATAIAGCGGGSSSSSSSSSASTSSTSTSSASTSPASTSSTAASYASLKPYLIQGNEEPGYAIQLPLEHYNTAAGYANGEQDPPAAQQLTHAGFRQALVENTGDGNGLSFVLEFATVADAAGYQSIELQQDLAGQGGESFRFSVPGVPGSAGFGARPVAGQGDANALFREGRCLLLVGDESAPHPHTYETAVIAGVKAIYARTHGRGVCVG